MFARNYENWSIVDRVITTVQTMTFLDHCIVADSVAIELSDVSK